MKQLKLCATSAETVLPIIYPTAVPALAEQSKNRLDGRGSLLIIHRDINHFRHSRHGQVGSIAGRIRFRDGLETPPCNMYVCVCMAWSVRSTQDEAATVPKTGARLFISHRWAFKIVPFEAHYLLSLDPTWAKRHYRELLRCFGQGVDISHHRGGNVLIAAR